MNVALITDQEHGSLTEGDQLLIQAFKKQRISALPAIWDNPTVEWAKFDFLILRSCWDYFDDIERFKSWLGRVENQGPKVINPSSTITWNLDKKYLFDLQAKGILVPETTLVSKGDSRTLNEILGELDTGVIIVKPCNGASAYGVLKVEKTKVDKFETQYRGLVTKADMLFQTFIPEIGQGEYSAVFIGDKLSHVILKKPKSGEFRSNAGFGATEELAVLTPVLETKVTEVYSRCGVQALFARLDFVLVSSNPVLMELELIEPYLFFEFKIHSADLFVSEFQKFTRTENIRGGGD